MCSTAVQCPTCSAFTLANGSSECECCAFWLTNGLSSDTDVRREASRLFRDYYELFLAAHDRRADPARHLGTCLREARRTTYTVIGWLQSKLQDLPTCCCCDRRVPESHKWRVCSDHRAWATEFRKRYGNRFVNDAAIGGFLIMVAGPEWNKIVAPFAAAGVSGDELWSYFEVELGDRLPPAPVVEVPTLPPVPDPVVTVSVVTVETPVVPVVVPLPPLSAVSAGPVIETPLESPSLLVDEPEQIVPTDSVPDSVPAPSSVPLAAAPPTEVTTTRKTVQSKPKATAKPKQRRLPRFNREWKRSDQDWFDRAEIFDRWPWMNDDDRAVEALAAIKDRWCAGSGLPKTGPKSATTIFTSDHLEDAVARIRAARRNSAKGRRR